MQSVGRNLLRCAISNEASLYGSSRALGTAAPEKDSKTKKEKKMNKKATHSLSYVQNMVSSNHVKSKLHRFSNDCAKFEPFLYCKKNTIFRSFLDRLKFGGAVIDLSVTI